MALSENFDVTTIPATWTVQQNNTTNTWSIITLPSGPSVATVDYNPTLASQSEWLISPSINLGNSAYYYLKFKVGLSYYWAVDPNNNYDAFVKISTENGVIWTQIWSELNLGTFSNFTLNSVLLDLRLTKITPM